MADYRVGQHPTAFYRAWVKWVRSDHPPLDKRYDRKTLLLYCWAMAPDGTNGLGVYTADATIADHLEMNRQTVTKYRELAIELGYFIRTVRVGRNWKLDIAIPDREPYPFVRVKGVNRLDEKYIKRPRDPEPPGDYYEEPEPEPVRHDLTYEANGCPLCRKYKGPHGIPWEIRDAHDRNLPIPQSFVEGVRQSI